MAALAYVIYGWSLNYSAGSSQNRAIDKTWLIFNDVIGVIEFQRSKTNLIFFADSWINWVNSGEINNYKLAKTKYDIKCG